MTASTLATLIIMGIIAASAAVLYQFAPGLKQGSSVDEITMISMSSSQALYSLGATNLPNCQALVTNGYLSSDAYTDCTNENTYGNTVTVLGAGATNTAALTYGFDESEQCLFASLNIDERIPEIVGVPSCNASNVLAWTVTSIRQ